MLKYITLFISHSQSYCLHYSVGVVVSYDVNPTDPLGLLGEITLLLKIPEPSQGQDLDDSRNSPSSLGSQAANAFPALPRAGDLGAQPRPANPNARGEGAVHTARPERWGWGWGSRPTPGLRPPAALPTTSASPARRRPSGRPPPRRTLRWVRRPPAPPDWSVIS